MTADEHDLSVPSDRRDAGGRLDRSIRLRCCCSNHQHGGRKAAKHEECSFAGWANLVLGVRRLCNNDDECLRNTVRAKMASRVIRYGALSYTSGDFRAEFMRPLDVVSRGLPDQGARA
jgi:hypothetical protein